MDAVLLRGSARQRHVMDVVDAASTRQFHRVFADSMNSALSELRRGFPRIARSRCLSMEDWKFRNMNKKGAKRTSPNTEHHVSERHVTRRESSQGIPPKEVEATNIGICRGCILRGVCTSSRCVAMTEKRSFARRTFHGVQRAGHNVAAALSVPHACTLLAGAVRARTLRSPECPCGGDDNFLAAVAGRADPPRMEKVLDKIIARVARVRGVSPTSIRSPLQGRTHLLARRYRVGSISEWSQPQGGCREYGARSLNASDRD
jgi:hypothetical protein